VRLEVEDSFFLPGCEQRLAESSQSWRLLNHELEVLAVVLWQRSRTSPFSGSYAPALSELHFVEEEGVATCDAHHAEGLVLAVAHVLESRQRLTLAEDELSIVLGFATFCHDFAEVRLAAVWVCV